MLLTGSTSWRMIASPPTRLNWHTTVTGPPEQGSWSAGGLLGSPVCKVPIFFCPIMFFLHGHCCCFFGFFWTAPQTQDQLTWLKHNGKTTLNVKQLPWVSCILLELRGVKGRPCVCTYYKKPLYFQYNYSKMFVQLLYSLFYDFVSVEAVIKYVKVSVRSRCRNS